MASGFHIRPVSTEEDLLATADLFAPYCAPTPAGTIFMSVELS